MTAEKRELDATQVMKGVLDTAVLGALRDGKAYGYDLVRRLRADGLADIAEASVYGTLRRLYRGGFLTSEIVESESGPPRKYYALNSSGKKELEGSIETWQSITRSMDRILQGGER